MFQFLFKRFRRKTFLALGDSIISDCYPGPDRGAASLTFRNVDREFPEFLGLDLASRKREVNFLNTSRSGYRLRDAERSLASLPRDLNVGWVLLSIGGNDLLSGELDQYEFGDRYAQFLEELRRRFPEADMAVLNAYDPTDGTGKVLSSIERGHPARPDILEGLEWLNRTIQKYSGNQLVDVHGHFLGHGVRHDDPEFPRRADHDRSLWFQRDIEPNPKGASELRRLICDKFKEGAHWSPDGENEGDREK